VTAFIPPQDVEEVQSRILADLNKLPEALDIECLKRFGVGSITSQFAGSVAHFCGRFVNRSFAAHCRLIPQPLSLQKGLGITTRSENDNWQEFLDGNSPVSSNSSIDTTAAEYAAEYAYGICLDPFDEVDEDPNAIVAVAEAVDDELRGFDWREFLPQEGPGDEAEKP